MCVTTNHTVDMNILVTGASNGIGYQTVLELLKNEKNNVFSISRNEGMLIKLQEESAQKKLRGTLTILSGDISRESDRQRIKLAVEKQINSLDILVNNAGQLINKPFDELSIEDWEMIFAVNVFAAAAMIRNLLPLLSAAAMKDAGYRSHIVNISSMGGLGGTSKFKGLSAYSSSKAAVVIMTECLAEEFKEKKISVNGLALGSVQTDMFLAAFPGAKAGTSPGEMGSYIADFAQNGAKFFNGKNIPVSLSTP